MRPIPQEQLQQRMRVENPWWDTAPHQIDKVYRDMRHRIYFQPLVRLVEQRDVRRAVVLMGPRRVGKTVLLQHTIQKLLGEGVQPRAVAYLSLDQPLYTNLSIEELARNVREVSGLKEKDPSFLFLDEIQYLRDWERHLKVFVDAFPNVKCIVSGSAAAALRLKSIESGAGRFTNFHLPPLAFYEYLYLQDIKGPGIKIEGGNIKIEPARGFDVGAFNEDFVRYLNIGGYPEVIFSPTIRSDVRRYVRSDIIDKVLLRDLPSLYGIQDIQELNSLLMSLAWNTAQEVSLDGLSKNSGVSKPTLKRYLEYLQAAFLIRVVHRIDYNAKRFKRANFFKVYLTNSAMRSALFGPICAEDADMGALTETAVFSQWFHASENITRSHWLKDEIPGHFGVNINPWNFYYARWPRGEVDMVFLDDHQRPRTCVEVKWSDKDIEQRQKHGPLKEFLEKHPDIAACYLTTRTRTGNLDMSGGRKIQYLPASVYCYMIGRVAADEIQADYE